MIGYRFVKPWLRQLIQWVDMIGYRWMVSQNQMNGPFQKILVVKLQNLGDTMAMIPVIDTVHSIFPGGVVDVLIRPSTQIVLTDYQLITKNIRHIWTMCPFDPRRNDPVPRWTWVTTAVKLRRERYDCVIDLRGDIRVAVWMQFLRTRMRIGFADGGGGWLYDRTVFPAKALGMIARDLVAVSMIGSIVNRGMVPVRYPVNPRILARIKRIVPPRYGIIHPGAGIIEKCLTIQDVRSVLAVLGISTDFPIRITGSVNDSNWMNGLLTPLSIDFSQVAAMITRDWRTLVAIVSGAEWVITSDTSVLHISGFLGKPLWPIFKQSSSDLLHQNVWCPYPRLDHCDDPAQALRMRS